MKDTNWILERREELLQKIDDLAEERKFKLRIAIHKITGLVDDVFKILPVKSADKNLEDV
jgi:hypothetical protein